MKNALTWMSHRSLVPFPSEEGIDVNFLFNSPSEVVTVSYNIVSGIVKSLLSK